MGAAEQSSARTPLTSARIVDQAIRIVDKDGVAGLSMRSLARSLGFEVMALYNHIANKQSLLSLMTDAIAGKVDGPPPGAAPLASVRAITISTRTVLLRHPWATEQWQRHLPGPARTNLMETLLRLLNESGLAPETAHNGFHAVTNHVIGYTLQETSMTLANDDATSHAERYVAGLSPEAHPYTLAHVKQHLAGDTASSFELVLDLILNGLEQLDKPHSRIG
jgi:AcrR family transcriptional regulator